VTIRSSEGYAYSVEFTSFRADTENVPPPGARPVAQLKVTNTSGRTFPGDVVLSDLEHTLRLLISFDKVRTANNGGCNRTCDVEATAAGAEYFPQEVAAGQSFEFDVVPADSEVQVDPQTTIPDVKVDVAGHSLSGQ
jgi:hypothetical protein